MITIKTINVTEHNRNKLILIKLYPRESMNDVITKLIDNYQPNLQEATISQAGQLSKTLAGKTILYKIKEPDGVNTMEPIKPETTSNTTNP